MASLRQKLNVLMVNYEFPPIGGGGGTTTRFLAKFLIKLGLNVTIVTSRSQDDNIYHHPEGFSIHYIGSKKSKISTTHIHELIRFGLLLIYHSKKLINIIKPDLLHCFFTLPSGSFGLFCKKRYNIPYITSVLGADVPGFNIGDWRLNTYHALTSVLSKAIWDNSSFIAANSQSLKDTCIKFSTKQDVKVISNGVDSDVFFPNKEKKEDKSNEVELLFISRLMYQKGIDTLIKACGILKEKNITNFRLNIVGDGHLKGLMFSLIEKFKLNERINFLGWRELEELPEIYRRADIFVLPSVMEGMPSVVLQAMASGLPIIGTKVKGFEEVLENNINGLSVEYNNHIALADAIEKLIKSPELREKMGTNSFNKVKNFSWESIAQKYLELYERSTFGESRDVINHVSCALPV